MSIPINGDYIDKDGKIRNFDGTGPYNGNGIAPLNGDYIDKDGKIRNFDGTGPYNGNGITITDGSIINGNFVDSKNEIKNLCDFIGSGGGPDPLPTPDESIVAINKGEVLIPEPSLGAPSYITYSPNGFYLAVIYSATPFMKIYRVENGFYELLPIEIPTGSAPYKICFSNDSKILFASIYSEMGDIIKTWSLENGLFVYKNDIIENSSKVTRSQGIAISSDDKYLVIGDVLSSNLLLYKKIDNKYKNILEMSVKNFEGAAATGLNSFSWSIDDNYLIVGGVSTSNSLYGGLYIYKFNKENEEFIFLTQIRETTSIRDIKFTPNNNYIAYTKSTSGSVGGNATVNIISKMDDIFTRILTSLPGYLSQTSDVCCWSSNSRYLFIAGGTRLEFYERYGSEFIRLYNLINGVTSSPTAMDLHPNNRQLIIRYSTTCVGYDLVWDKNNS